MQKLHESDPDNYKICGSCTGTGKKVELKEITCPQCRGSGSIERRNKIKLEPSPPRLSQSPRPKSKEELKDQFDQELSKANQLKSSLLAAVQSSVRLPADVIQLSKKLISSIDPLSKATETSLEMLQREWAKELPKNDPLLVHLREFKISCFAVETYYVLVR